MSAHPAGGVYRPDIDGLRAVAVVPVVLFHYAFPGFAGGFVGVDVFFVISGFLITTVIDREMAAGTFSLLRFYERRVRRIFPALFAVLLVMLLASVFLSLPGERRLVASSAAAAALFCSNVVFWRRAGYFDRSSEVDPLLHTWSLGVEEQFYLVFPAGLMLLRSFSPKRRTTLLAGAGLASWGIALWAASHAPEAGFYLLFSRLWEMLLGALLALRVVRVPARFADVASAAGLGLIVFAIARFSSGTPYPGAAALAPCLGTLLVIAAGVDRTPLVNRVLSWRPLVFVGLVSYSLYLWHWPLVVVAREYALPLLGRPLRLRDALALAVVALGCSVGSWRWIERPFRDPQRFRGPLVLRLGLVSIVVACAASAAVATVRGWPERVVPSLLEPPPRVVDVYGCADRTEAEVVRDGPCPLGARSGPPRFVLWGDSHATALAPALDLAGQRLGIAGGYATRNGCPPLLDVSTAGDRRCRDPWERSFLDRIQRDGYRTVVVALRWTLYTEGTDTSESLTRKYLTDDRTTEPSTEDSRRVLTEALPRTIQALRKRGLNVVLVGPVPEVGGAVPETAARLRLLGRPVVIGPERGAFEQRARYSLDLLRRVDPGVSIVYPHERLCTPSLCSATTPEGAVLYDDANHLSLVGSRQIAAVFEAPLDQAKQGPPQN